MGVAGGRGSRGEGEGVGEEESIKGKTCWTVLRNSVCGFYHRNEMFSALLPLNSFLFLSWSALTFLLQSPSLLRDSSEFLG